MSIELLKKPPKRARLIQVILFSLAGVTVALVIILWLASGVGSNSSQNLVAGGTAAFSPVGTATSNQAANLTRTSEGGQVTLKITWQGFEAGPVFTVAMDTHSVNLDSYDLSRMAVLKTPSGQEIKAVSWEAPTGGHHRMGTLRFPATTTGNQPVLTPGSGSFQMVIRGVGELPERTLTWNW
jgi:hypothetical protein